MNMSDPRGGGPGNAALGHEQSLPGTQDAGTSGGQAGSSTKDQIRQTRDKVVDQARSTMQSARERAGSGLAEGRRQAADQLGGIGTAFHRTGEQLRGEDQARFADLADSVGRRLDRAADYLRESDGRAITRDLEGLARRQPAVVFAGAFALGLAAARFLKSSEPSPDLEAGAGGFDAPA